jgi:hypothetical protein
MEGFRQSKGGGSNVGAALRARPGLKTRVGPPCGAWRGIGVRTAPKPDDGKMALWAISARRAPLLEPREIGVEFNLELPMGRAGGHVKMVAAFGALLPKRERGIARFPGSLWAAGCGCARDARSRAHRS